MTSAPLSQPTSYPGQRLGLPEEGRGSVATFPRRLAAILVDWALCWIIAIGAFGVQWGATGTGSLVPLAVLAVENVLLVSTLGTTVGHRMLGLQVHRLLPTPARTAYGASRLGGPPGFGRGTVRTALLCLALPAMVSDADARGLHDKAAGTVIVRAF